MALPMYKLFYTLQNFDFIYLVHVTLRSEKALEVNNCTPKTQ